jgi:hypothetical protein
VLYPEACHSRPYLNSFLNTIEGIVPVDELDYH